MLYLSDPPGVHRTTRRHMIEDVAKLNRLNLKEFGDPETLTRIAQYELAYRMQIAAPELVDVSKEPDSIFDLYGPESRKPGTYAANCLLARRLAERGVRCIQLFHRGWDQHKNLPKQIEAQCRDYRPADRGPHRRPQATRHAGRYSGHLGRRIWSHGLL